MAANTTSPFRCPFGTRIQTPWSCGCLALADTQHEHSPWSQLSPCLSCWAQQAFWQEECRKANPIPGASGSPEQWHKDVFLPASRIPVTVQESQAGLGLAMQS